MVSIITHIQSACFIIFLENVSLSLCSHWQTIPNFQCCLPWVSKSLLTHICTILHSRELLVPTQLLRPDLAAPQMDCHSQPKRHWLVDVKKITDCLKEKQEKYVKPISTVIGFVNCMNCGKSWLWNSWKRLLSPRRAKIHQGLPSKSNSCDNQEQEKSGNALQQWANYKFQTSQICKKFQ